jgi:amino-acid N-acetyltransferase
MSVTLRTAARPDASAIHNLVTANLENGHLLPRSIEDIESHIARFYVAVLDEQVVGCAELAPLSPSVAEVRSLVVQESRRGQRIGTRLVSHLANRATVGGFATLCAFTHDPSHFVKLGFTIVPHIWMPEKIAHDCTACALFRRCGQYAVRRGLRLGTGAAPERTAAMIHGRGVAPRRPNIERLQLTPVGNQPRTDTKREDERKEPVLV